MKTIFSYQSIAQRSETSATGACTKANEISRHIYYNHYISLKVAKAVSTLCIRTRTTTPIIITISMAVSRMSMRTTPTTTTTTITRINTIKITSMAVSTISMSTSAAEGTEAEAIEAAVEVNLAFHK